MQAITLELILRVVFGEDEDPARLERLAKAMTDLARAGQNRLAMIPWLRHDLGRYSPTSSCATSS
jgi:hypothetical protein